MNIDRLIVFSNFARELATLSKCEERRVAAIIADYPFTQIFSVGINGGPKGLDQCMCNTEGKYGCVHAEINALVKCTSTATNKVMIVTLAPCKQCAAAIINSGICAVYYLEKWKDNSGILLLEKSNVNVYYVPDICNESVDVK